MKVLQHEESPTAVSHGHPYEPKDANSTEQRLKRRRLRELDAPKLGAGFHCGTHPFHPREMSDADNLEKELQENLEQSRGLLRRKMNKKAALDSANVSSDKGHFVR